MLLNPYRFGGGGPAPVDLYIASAGDNGLFISDDRVTWTLETMPTGFWSWNISLINGTLVTVDGGLADTLGAATSADGTAWDDQTTPAQADQYGWYGTATDGSRVVAVGQTDSFGSPTEAAMYSDDDGVTWAMGTIAAGEAWMTALWAPEISLFIAQAKYGDDVAATSPDGATWTLRTVASHNVYFEAGAGAWSGAKYRCVGNRTSDDVTYVLKSANGTSYSVATAAVALAGATWGPTIWDGAQFVAIGYLSGTSYILTSSDGDTWAQNANTIAADCLSLTFDGINYVAVAYDGTTGADVYSSTDLTTWSNVGTLPGTGYSIYGVKHFQI